MYTYMNKKAIDVYTYLYMYIYICMYIYISLYTLRRIENNESVIDPSKEYGQCSFSKTFDRLSICTNVQRYLRENISNDSTFTRYPSALLVL